MRNHNKTILKPVAPEQFNSSFSAAASQQQDVTTLFANTIKHVNHFAVGKYFWFIADASKGITAAAGGMLEKMLPVTMEQFVHYPPEILFRNTHPEDLPKMFAFTNYWINHIMPLPAEKRSQLRPTIYIRLLNSQGSYYWVMTQFAETIYDEQHNIMYGFTLVTDISHIRKEGPVMMSILDMQDESCQLFFCSDANMIIPGEEELPKITARELEVLQLLAAGNSSKQIAAALNTAVKTIDNHRQNLLRKTNTKSSGELVAYGINWGYI